MATFGFLEEVLGKAIFSFTATRPYEDHEIDAAFAAWVPKLARALSDPLGSLIDSYENAVKSHPGATIGNLSELTTDLRKAAIMRNIICHGSWRAPDSGGFSLPLFVNRKNQIVETFMDIDYLKKVQLHTTELACAVMNSVTHMGWQFPGSKGPGTPIISLNGSADKNGSMTSVRVGIEQKKN